MSVSDAHAPLPSVRPAHPRRAVASWALWDWGSSAYSTIVVSFVFAPYLTNTVGGPDAALGLSGATWLGISTASAGVLIAVLAPVTGQRADEGGRRRASLALFTALVIVSTLGLFFVKDSPSYLWLGLVLMAAGSVFMEFAYVSYNAMLHQISTPANIGRISGFGWGSGYLGGIVVLLVAYLLFISPEVGLFGVTDAEGLRYRVLALVVAVWFGVFAIPVLLAVPEVPATQTHRMSYLDSYKKLIRDVRALFRTDRQVVWFLLASAIYRDGLAAVFSFGAVLAVSVYGLSASGVVIFGVAANVVAAVGAFVGGLIEDRIGPKTDHPGLPRRSGRLRDRAALRVRLDDVLDLRAGAVPVGGAGAGQLAVVPGPARPARAGGSAVRPVRDDRPGGVVPGPRVVRPVRRGVRERPDGYRRDSCRAVGRWGVHGLCSTAIGSSPGAGRGCSIA